MAAPSKSSLVWKLATLFSVSALVVVAAAHWKYRQTRSDVIPAVDPYPVPPAAPVASTKALDRGIRRDAPIVMDIDDIVEAPRAPAVAKDSNFPTPKFNEHHHHH